MVIGHDVSEQLDVEPAKYFVVVTKREKRVCKHCEEAGVVAALAPERIIEKSLVSDRVVIDTVVRYVPGVLGDPESLVEESHSETGRLEYPQYTRPRVFRGMEVPEVLTSGDHQAVARWRREQSQARSAGPDQTTTNVKEGECHEKPAHGPG